MSNSAPRHEDAWGGGGEVERGGGKAVSIFNSCYKWMLVISFTPQTLRTPHPLQGDGPSRYQMGYRRCGAENMPFPCRELNPYSPSHPAHSLYTSNLNYPASRNVFQTILSFSGNNRFPLVDRDSSVGISRPHPRPDRSWGPSIVLQWVPGLSQG